MFLVLRRVGIVAVAIAVADSAVGPVDDDLDLLSLRLLACLLERFLLRVGGVADALRAFLAGGPATVVRHDVNILLGHHRAPSGAKPSFSSMDGGVLPIDRNSASLSDIPSLC